MLVKVRATGEHLLSLARRPGVEGCELINEENVKRIEEWPQAPHAWSFIDEDKKVWGIAGILALEPTLENLEPRWEAWLIIDPDAGKYMVCITRIIREYFANFDASEIEANVRRGFESGHRYMRVLGFKESGKGNSELLGYVLKKG